MSPALLIQIGRDMRCLSWIALGYGMCAGDFMWIGGGLVLLCLGRGAAALASMLP